MPAIARGCAVNNMHTNGILKTVARKEGIAHAEPPRHQALRAAAESLSLRNVDQAICELFNEAIARMTLLAYEQDAGGFCNIDAVTGKLLIAAPWGRNGQTKWGIRPQEANILRQVLFDWQYPGPTLWLYDRVRRAWFLNLYDFADYETARKWLARHQVTIEVYRAARAKRVDRG